MNWKKLFSISVTGEVSNPDSETLKKNVNNNLTIMNWMYLVMLITLSSLLVLDATDKKIIALIFSVLILVFINSLHLSQRMDKIILEIRED